MNSTGSLPLAGGPLQAGVRPALNAKCVHCGRMYAEHTANGHYCPIGAKHRTLGFMQYDRRKQFTPVEKA